MTATGHIPIVILPDTTDATPEPCNACAFGTHLDPAHYAGQYLVSYYIANCPLCDLNGLRSRPRVRRMNTHALHAK